MIKDYDIILAVADSTLILAGVEFRQKHATLQHIANIDFTGELSAEKLAQEIQRFRAEHDFLTHNVAIINNSFECDLTPTELTKSEVADLIKSRPLSEIHDQITRYQLVDIAGKSKYFSGSVSTDIICEWDKLNHLDLHLTYASNLPIQLAVSCLQGVAGFLVMQDIPEVILATSKAIKRYIPNTPGIKKNLNEMANKYGIDSLKLEALVLEIGAIKTPDYCKSLQDAGIPIEEYYSDIEVLYADCFDFMKNIIQSAYNQKPNLKLSACGKWSGINGISQWIAPDDVVIWDNIHTTVQVVDKTRQDCPHGLQQILIACIQGVYDRVLNFADAQPFSLEDETKYLLAAEALNERSNDNAVLDGDMLEKTEPVQEEQSIDTSPSDTIVQSEQNYEQVEKISVTEDDSAESKQGTLPTAQNLHDHNVVKPDISFEPQRVSTSPNKRPEGNDIQVDPRYTSSQIAEVLHQRIAQNNVREINFANLVLWFGFILFLIGIICYTGFVSLNSNLSVAQEIEQLQIMRDDLALRNAARYSYSRMSSRMFEQYLPYIEYIGRPMEGTTVTDFNLIGDVSLRINGLCDEERDFAEFENGLRSIQNDLEILLVEKISTTDHGIEFSFDIYPRKGESVSG